MTARTLPGIGLTGDIEQGAPWKVAGDRNWLLSSVLTQTSVESATTALPASPLNGVMYIVPADDLSFANQIAARDNGAWSYFPPQKGWTAYVRDTGVLMNFDSTAWVPSTTPLAAPGGAAQVGYAAEYGSANNAKQMFDRIGPATNLFGVIRQATSGGGWTFINDAGHRPRDFGVPVTNGDGSLTIPFAFTAAKVGSIAITSDETFSALGIVAGLSIGTASAVAWAYKTLDVAINLSTLGIAPSTYFAGKVTAALVPGDDGIVEVTHPTVGSVQVVPNLQGSDQTLAYQNRILSYTATTVRIGAFTSLAGLIAFDGTNWVVTTGCKNKPTATFNTSTGVLTVVHESVPTETLGTIVSSVDNATVVARVGTVGTNSFQVLFRPLAGGAPVLAPTTDMKFRYFNQQLVRREKMVGNVVLSRPNCQLDLNQVYSAIGNFWINGLMWEA